MKKYFLCFIFCSIFYSAITQKWQQTIGVANKSESSMRVLEHYDNGYLISGSLSSSNEGGHGWIIKTTINGDLLWDKEIGIGSDAVVLGNTILDENGNFYLFGVIEQEPNNLWPLSLKLNSCGEKIWCRKFYYPDHMMGYFTDAILKPNGDLLALANMPTNDILEMIYLFCISPEGELKWKKSFASKADHPTFDTRYGDRIQKFGDTYIISGYVYSPHPNNPGVVSIRPMFIGIDTTFTEQWVLEFGLEDNMKGKAVETLAINDSLLMGVGRYRYDNTKDAWAMYYNKQGEQVGYTLIKDEDLGLGIYESTFYEVERVNDTLYMATSGYFYGEDEDNAMGEILFDTAGTVYDFTLREQTNGHPSLIKTNDDKFVVSTSLLYEDLTWDILLYKIQGDLIQDTVYPGNYTYDSLCPYQIESGEIDVSNCTIVSLEEIPSPNDYFASLQNILINAYPNPSKNNFVTLSFTNTSNFSNMKLKCFDVFGKEIHSEIVYRYQGENEIDISQWQSGVYFVIVYSDEKAVGEGKFVVQ